MRNTKEGTISTAEQERRVLQRDRDHEDSQNPYPDEDARTTEDRMLDKRYPDKGGVRKSAPEPEVSEVTVVRKVTPVRDEETLRRFLEGRRR